MNTRLRCWILLLGLSLLSGCVAYTPYDEYDGGYGYAAPVVPVPLPPVPMYYGGWGHHRHHHHHHW